MICLLYYTHIFQSLILGLCAKVVVTQFRSAIFFYCIATISTHSIVCMAFCIRLPTWFARFFILFKLSHKGLKQKLQLTLVFFPVSISFISLYCCVKHWNSLKDSNTLEGLIPCANNVHVCIFLKPSHKVFASLRFLHHLRCVLRKQKM